MTAHISSTQPLQPGRLVTGTAVIVARNVRRVLRVPQLLVFAAVQPVMFLLLFTYVFGGAIEKSIPASTGNDYIDFLLPGLLVQVSVFGSAQTAIGLAEDLASGAVDRFRSLPMARSALLAGRAIADLIRNGFVMILLLGVGALIGFRADTSFAGVVAGILVVLAFSFSLSWVMAMLALKVRNAEAVQTAVFLCVFPFVFASAVFVPPSTMPSWLQPFAEHQPVTVVAEAVRGLMLGEDALPAGHTVAGQVGLALAWCLGITAVAAPTAVAIYRRRR